MPIIIFFALVLISLSSNGADRTSVHAGAFSSLSTEQVFQQWQPYGFDKVKRKTAYSHVKHEGEWIIKAESFGSASGLTRRIDIDLQKLPIISWHWKISAIPKNATDHTREGDDHAARLYIIFNTPDENLLGKIKQGLGIKRTHAINYIWANNMEVGSFRHNPYSSRSIMLAVNTGKRQAGDWVSHERNLLNDYRKIFGQDPPRVSALAIMTDTDNGQGHAITYYGDIVFSSAD